MPGLLESAGSFASGWPVFAFGPAFFALLCVASGLKGWVLTEATVNGVSGPVTIGLWQACADFPCEEDDDVPDAVCKVETVFSDLGGCRQGHCITGKSLTPGSSWEANELCDRSAAGSAFSVIAILLMAYYTKLTTGEKLFKNTPRYEAAAWISLFAGFAGLISFGLMTRWVGIMNKEEGENRSKEDDRIVFGKLTHGFGFWLQVIAVVLLFVNAGLTALAFIESKRVSGGTIDTSGLAAGEQGGQNVPYEESRTTAAVTQNEAYLAVEGAEAPKRAPPAPNASTMIKYASGRRGSLSDV